MIIKIALFIAMQIAAALLFKWGSGTKEHWLAGFVLGNVIGASSIWFLMGVFKQMNPNIAMGICMGGSFLFTQIALMLVFKSHINLLQWAGIGMIAVGVMIVSVTADAVTSVAEPATAREKSVVK